MSLVENSFFSRWKLYFHLAKIFFIERKIETEIYLRPQMNIFARWKMLSVLLHRTKWFGVNPRLSTEDLVGWIGSGLTTDERGFNSASLHTFLFFHSPKNIFVTRQIFSPNKKYFHSTTNIFTLRQIPEKYFSSTEKYFHTTTNIFTLRQMSEKYFQTTKNILSLQQIFSLYDKYL